jgi:hypothetical protein
VDVGGGWDGGSVEVVENLLGSGDAVAIVKVSRGGILRGSWVGGVGGVWSMELGEARGTRNVIRYLADSAIFVLQLKWRDTASEQKS